MVSGKKLISARILINRLHNLKDYNVNTNELFPDSLRLFRDYQSCQILPNWIWENMFAL